MITNSWVMRASPEAKEKMEQWLLEESVGGYDLTDSPEAVEVGFRNIDDAFRFRLHFDEELFQSTN